MKLTGQGYHKCIKCRIYCAIFDSFYNEISEFKKLYCMSQAWWQMPTNTIPCKTGVRGLQVQPPPGLQSELKSWVGNSTRHHKKIKLKELGYKSVVHFYVTCAKLCSMLRNEWMDGYKDYR